MASPDPVQPAITAELLAKLFYGLSQSVDDYRIGHWETLSEGERGRLKDEAQSLDTRAHYFTAEALGDALQAIASDLQQIDRTTADAKAALAVLKKGVNAVRIATAATALAAAIATGDPATVAGAVAGLGKAILDARGEESAGPV